MYNDLFEDIACVVVITRGIVDQSDNFVMCVTYFEIGRRLSKHEQTAGEWVRYGEGLLRDLSLFLTERFGKGFSVTAVRHTRAFYKTYVTKVNSTTNDNGETIICQIDDGEEQAMQTILPVEKYPFKLKWNHYHILYRIKNDDERIFYETEAFNRQWSYKQLLKEFNSSLYERLALSRNKDEINRLDSEDLLMRNLLI